MTGRPGRAPMTADALQLLTTSAKLGLVSREYQIDYGHLSVKSSGGETRVVQTTDTGTSTAAQNVTALALRPR